MAQQKSYIAIDLKSFYASVECTERNLDAMTTNLVVADKAKLVTKEMIDMLSLDLVDKGLVTDQIVLTIGYDIDNLTDPSHQKQITGSVKTDRYGRKIPDSHEQN